MKLNTVAPQSQSVKTMVKTQIYTDPFPLAIFLVRFPQTPVSHPPTTGRTRRTVARTPFT
jgi:hypothetical protein